MTCIQWHDDQVLAEQFFSTATCEELKDAWFQLAKSLDRWRERHPPTAERLQALADRLWDVGSARFGDDFCIPF